MKAPLLFFIMLTLILISCSQPQPEPEPDVYLFSYFKGNGEDGLHLAASDDGLTWTALNNDSSFLRPRLGEEQLMRDPSIVQGPTGEFHMVWTIGWNARSIGYAHSPDLLNWSEQRTLPVMEHEPAAENCWAPELFYDDATDEFVIVWSTTIPGRFPETDDQSNSGEPGKGRNHRMYYVTTKDFSEISDTKLFYDHGFNVIDGAIVRTDSLYYLFLKDETNKPFEPQKNIRIATSPSATGPYSPPSAPITGEYWAEGPTAIEIDGVWRLYFDTYRKHGFGLMVSDDLQTWREVDALSHPEGMRHGTVFRVSPSVLNRIKTGNAE